MSIEGHYRKGTYLRTSVSILILLEMSIEEWGVNIGALTKKSFNPYFVGDEYRRLSRMGDGNKTQLVSILILLEMSIEGLRLRVTALGFACFNPYFVGDEYRSRLVVLNHSR